MTRKTRKHQLFLGTIFVLLLLAYFPLRGVQDNDFVNYDDYRYVLENQNVREGIRLGGIRWAFSNLEAGFWHPLTWLSHMLDVELFGVNPKGHHLTSLLLHLANTLLLFLVLERATGNRSRSALVAALFAVHPLHVESVAWVSQRKDLLSTLFWNLALLSYVGRGSAPGKRRVISAFLFFCLGLMAKSIVVTLPLVLLLLDYWPLRRIQKRKGSLSPLILEKVPFLALSAGFAVITYYAERSLGALPGLEAYPAHVRVYNAVVSYATYPLKMIFPFDLSPIYLHPGSFPFWSVAAGVAFVLCVSCLVFHQTRIRPYLFVGWSWYLITLLPVVGLIQIGSHAYADRYTYIPLTGLFLMTVWSLPSALSRTDRSRVALGLVITSAIVGLSWITSNQVAHWKNSISLFSKAVRANSENYLAHNNLGFTLAQRGRFEEAAKHYEIAIGLNPSYPEALFNLANTLETLGRKDEAISYYGRVLDLAPHLAKPHSRLGRLLLQKGKREEALVHLKAATQLDPSDRETMELARGLQENMERSP